MDLIAYACLNMGSITANPKSWMNISLSHRFGLRHVGDDAVGDDEEDEVLRSVGEAAGDVGHVVDGGREVGRAVQLDTLDARSVRPQDTCKIMATMALLSFRPAATSICNSDTLGS